MNKIVAVIVLSCMALSPAFAAKSSGKIIDELSDAGFSWFDGLTTFESSPDSDGRHDFITVTAVKKSGELVIDFYSPRTHVSSFDRVRLSLDETHRQLIEEPVSETIGSRQAQILQHVSDINPFSGNPATEARRTLKLLIDQDNKEIVGFSLVVKVHKPAPWTKPMDKVYQKRIEKNYRSQELTRK